MFKKCIALINPCFAAPTEPTNDTKKLRISAKEEKIASLLIRTVLSDCWITFLGSFDFSLTLFSFEIRACENSWKANSLVWRLARTKFYMRSRKMVAEKCGFCILLWLLIFSADSVRQKRQVAFREGSTYFVRYFWICKGK